MNRGFSLSLLCLCLSGRLKLNVAGRRYRRACSCGLPSLYDSIRLRFACTQMLMKVHIRSFYRTEPKIFRGKVKKTRYRPGGGETLCPRQWQFDGGKNCGGFTSVRGRFRSPHISGGRRWLSYRQPACP